MPAPTPGQSADLTPIFVTVKDAAKMLAITPWSVYQLLNEEKIASQYHGRRRLVSVASLRAYAAGLPTKAEKDATA